MFDGQITYGDIAITILVLGILAVVIIGGFVTIIQIINRKK